jgi:cell division protein FtsQ
VTGRTAGWLALVAVLLGGAGWVVGFTGVLGVRSVTVTGTRTLAASHVVEVADVRLGQPLLRVNTEAVADRVRTIPGVARVAVRRAWPSALRIVVTERTGVAVVQRDGVPWLIDRDGVVFQRLAARPHAMPRLDVRAPGSDDPPTLAALAALSALPAELIRQVSVVSAPTEHSVTLTLTGNRTVVWGGPEDGAAKARVLPALLQRPGTRYDVSTPSVVTVR